MQFNPLTKEANPIIWTLYQCHDPSATLASWNVRVQSNKRAKIAEAIRLLDDGYDPNEKLDDDTAIGIAMWMGLHEVVDRLLTAGADVTHPVGFKNSVIYKWIALSKANDDTAPEKGVVLQKLLRAGADLYMRDENGDSFLHAAEKHVNPYAITALVAAGLDINTTNNDGRTVLHHSIHNWRMEALNAVLAASPDVNARDHANYTALSYAIKGLKFMLGDTTDAQATLDVIRRLIEENAATDFIDSEGNSLLHLAMNWGYNKMPYMSFHQTLAIRHELVALLIERGLDVNARNHLGQTPLMLAISACDVDSVRHLCAIPGIDRSARDLMGNTAMKRAILAKTSAEKYETRPVELVPIMPLLSRSSHSDSIPFIPTTDHYNTIIELLS